MEMLKLKMSDNSYLSIKKKVECEFKCKFCNFFLLSQVYWVIVL